MTQRDDAIWPRKATSRPPVPPMSAALPRVRLARIAGLSGKIAGLRAGSITADAWAQTKDARRSGAGQPHGAQGTDA
jgi:hypothetical protein